MNHFQGISGSTAKLHLFDFQIISVKTILQFCCTHIVNNVNIVKIKLKIIKNKKKFIKLRISRIQKFFITLRNFSTVRYKKNILYYIIKTLSYHFIYYKVFA